MEVTVTGKHIDITDSIRQYAQEKVGKLPKFYDRITSVQVIADRYDSHRFQVELIAHVDGHEHVVASSQHDDLYACLDETVDKMGRQLHDLKDKLRNHKKHGPE
ncbi:MAG: ribosome-associated translation inhibitor RaiA [Phycisphaeraceae bacterium]|nr:ribosome-associated translation inhibitor RaiA [Phycisphaeraceae bacterium]